MRSATIMRAVCCLIVLSVGVSGTSTAADTATTTQTVQQIDIRPQPVSSALNSLALQTHHQILFTPEIVTGKTTSGVNGALTVDRALDQLLVGTGLSSSKSPGGMILVSQTDAKGASASTGPSSAPIGASNDQTTNSTMSTQDRGTRLEEVVVTAEKRTERLLDVPMSISATSGEQLTDSGILSTSNLQQVTPGIVTVHNGLAFTPAIRGVSSIGTSPGDETNVSVYLDDVYLGSPLAGIFDLSDIERVEILKGPQGTLFGRNATGGAIRIVTRAPSFTPEADVSADYGFNYEEVKLGGYVTGPILADTVAGSLSASYRSGDGYISGIGPDAGKRYGKPNNYLVRGKLLFKPADTLQATLAASAWKNDDNSIFVAAPDNGLNPYPGPGSIVNTPYHYAGLSQPIARVNQRSVSLDATWDPVSWVTARSITAYSNTEGVYQTDQSRTNTGRGGLDIAQNQQTFSQEFNFSGPSDQAIEWLLGAYYYHSLADNPYFAAFITTAPSGALGASFTDSQISNSYAGFADLTWNITSQLHVTGGARYTTETKEYNYRDLFRFGGAPLRHVLNQTTWDDPTFRGVIRYDFAADANVYASWSDGFKSGVYNAYSPVGNPVAPEKIKAIEVGAKARIHGITFTAAAFDYAYDNIQVQANALFSGVFVVTLTNAARAKLQGGEVTAEGNLTDHLSFNAGIGALPTARYENFTTAQVFVPNAKNLATSVAPYDASGSRVIRAPKWTDNARLTYATAFLGGQFAGSINDSYVSGIYWQPGNLTHTGGYNLINARLSWTDPNDRLTYSVWATDLTDKIYSLYTTSSTLGDASTYAPRGQIGVGIAAKF